MTTSAYLGSQLRPICMLLQLSICKYRPIPNFQIQSFNHVRYFSSSSNIEPLTQQNDIKYTFLDPDNKFLHQKRIAASRLGADPLTNRFHHPIVSHEDYSFKDWPPNHTFPMDKFARLAHALLNNCRKTQPQFSRLPHPLVKQETGEFVSLSDTGLNMHLLHSYF